MKKFSFLKNSWLCLIISLFIIGGSGDIQGQSPPSYELIDLGFLPCEGFPGTFCDSSEANAINEKGSIVGVVEIAEPHCFHAGLYRNGEWQDLGLLGTPPGDVTPSSHTRDVNNLDQVVGMSMTSLPPSPDGTPWVSHAFLWDEEGGMRDLGALGQHTSCFVVDGEQFCFTNHYSEALAINDHGVVVGATTTHDSDRHAFIWDEEGGMRDLGTLPGPFPFSEAVDINNRGEVVGNSSGRAFIYKNGVMKDLDENLPFSQAQAINNVGEVVLRVGSKWYLWRNGVMKELPPFPGDSSAQALNLNDRGQVVGVSYFCPEFCTLRPVLWDGDDVIDLAGPEGAWFNEARGINNRGQVAVTSQFADPPFITRGYLAEPH